MVHSRKQGGRTVYVPAVSFLVGNKLLGFSDLSGRGSLSSNFLASHNLPQHSTSPIKQSRTGHWWPTIVKRHWPIWLYRLTRVQLFK